MSMRIRSGFSAWAMASASAALCAARHSKPRLLNRRRSNSTLSGSSSTRSSRGIGFLLMNRAGSGAHNLDELVQESFQILHLGHVALLEDAGHAAVEAGPVLLRQ